MSEISDMIQRLCPDGVEYRKLGEVVSCLSLSARRRGPCKNPSLSGISSHQRCSDIPPRLRRGVAKQ